MRVDGVIDKTKIFECGTGISSRGMEPTDPDLKQKCNGILTEISADKVNVFADKNEFINKMMCC